MKFEYNDMVEITKGFYKENEAAIISRFWFFGWIYHIRSRLNGIDCYVCGSSLKKWGEYRRKQNEQELEMEKMINLEKLNKLYEEFQDSGFADEDFKTFVENTKDDGEPVWEWVD